MEFEDEIILEDDFDAIDLLEFGFPRREYTRTNYFDDLDDLSFFRRFRLSKNAVMSILDLIENQLEFDNDNGNNSVSPINQLLLALRFYASNNQQIGLGDYIGCSQATASRIIRRVTNAIAGLRPLYIEMPNRNNMLLTNEAFYEKARFPRVVGCIDGTHIKLQSPGGIDAEVYRNRKGYFSINTQVIGGPNLKIFDIVSRWPGSTHDQTIFNNSRIKAAFEEGVFENNVLLGDSGYALTNYLLTPLNNVNTRAERLYNSAHIHTRNTVERLFGVWKRRFPAIAYGLRCNVDTSMAIIVATAVLHNIAIARNEPEPPPINNVNAVELNHLIEQGNIPDVPVANLPRNLAHNYRQLLINNYFSNI